MIESRVVNELKVKKNCKSLFKKRERGKKNHLWSILNTYKDSRRCWRSDVLDIHHREHWRQEASRDIFSWDLSETQGWWETPRDERTLIHLCPDLNISVSQEDRELSWKSHSHPYSHLGAIWHNRSTYCILLGAERKVEMRVDHEEKHVKHHKGSNLSLGSIQGPWSCQAARLPSHHDWMFQKRKSWPVHQNKWRVLCRQSLCCFCRG